ncbi:MAG: hypothetical protein WC460_00405 [Patescibacteria group bacterium]
MEIYKTEIVPFGRCKRCGREIPLSQCNEGHDGVLKHRKRHVVEKIGNREVQVFTGWEIEEGDSEDKKLSQYHLNHTRQGNFEMRSFYSVRIKNENDKIVFVSGRVRYEDDDPGEDSKSGPYPITSGEDDDTITEIINLIEKYNQNLEPNE